MVHISEPYGAAICNLETHMKLGTVMMEIVSIGDFIFMFWGLDLVSYIVGCFVYCIYHIT